MGKICVGSEGLGISFLAGFRARPLLLVKKKELQFYGAWGKMKDTTQVVD